jgi:hypothetical protein
MKRLSLHFMIKQIKNRANEIAIGYNDNYCAWHIYYGGRGCSNHIDGCGKYLYSDEDDFYKAVKYFYNEIVLK